MQGHSHSDNMTGAAHAAHRSSSTNSGLSLTAANVTRALPEAAVSSGEVPAGREEEPRFDLVFVCTGNRFRSPLAAALMARAVAGLPVRVGSLGTLDAGPQPPLRTATKQAAKHGLDLSGHRAHSLAGADLSGADLVVGFETAHVGAAVLDGLARRDRTFLLTELVELLEIVAPPPEDDVVASARAAVGLAAEARREGLRVGQAEIPDPMGASARVTRAVTSDLVRMTAALTEALFNRPPRA